MYTPFKQNLIQTQFGLILSKVRFRNFIDKNIIKSLLDCSEKTVERRLKTLKLIHMKNELIDCLIDYEAGIDTSSLACRLNCSEVNINSLARRHQVTRPLGFKNTLKSDFNFFDSIDTEEKAYILGFFAADGCITDHEMKIALSSVDIDILYKIKEAMHSEVLIRNYETTCSLNNKQSNVSVFSIASQYMVKSLRALGYDKDKTTTCKFPSISNKMYIHFIRGYFDGDGSMTKYVTNGYTKYSLNICGTESFLLTLKSFIEENYNFNFNSKLTKRFNTDNCCYSLNMSGKHNCMQFLSLLYDDSSIYLDRKYNKYMSFY